jgi:hypothetical protein
VSSYFVVMPFREANLSLTLPFRSCRIRLFSTKRGSSLGVLDYHRDTCHTVCFPSLSLSGDRERKGTKREEDEDEDEDEDDVGMGQKAKVGKWLVSGGKDRRVVIWELKEFKRQ